MTTTNICWEWWTTRTQKLDGAWELMRNGWRLSIIFFSVCICNMCGYAVKALRFVIFSYFLHWWVHQSRAAHGASILNLVIPGGRFVGGGGPLNRKALSVNPGRVCLFAESGETITHLSSIERRVFSSSRLSIKFTRRSMMMTMTVMMMMGSRVECTLARRTHRRTSARYDDWRDSPPPPE